MMFFLCVLAAPVAIASFLTWKIRGDNAWRGTNKAAHTGDGIIWFVIFFSCMILFGSCMSEISNKEEPPNKKPEKTAQEHPPITILPPPPPEPPSKPTQIQMGGLQWKEITLRGTFRADDDFCASTDSTSRYSLIEEKVGAADPEIKLKIMCAKKNEATFELEVAGPRIIIGHREEPPEKIEIPRFFRSRVPVLGRYDRNHDEGLHLHDYLYFETRAGACVAYVKDMEVESWTDGVVASCEPPRPASVTCSLSLCYIYSSKGLEGINATLAKQAPIDASLQ